MIRLRLTSVALVAGLWLASGVPAAAHTPGGLASGLAGGLLHPLSGPDHLLAMIAVGLWAAFLGGPLVYRLPLVSCVGIVLGGVLGVAGVGLSGVEIGIAASVLLLGVALLARWRAPAWVATAIVGLCGLVHGYAHGHELPSTASPLAYGLGFVLATTLLHLLGIAIGLVRERSVGKPMPRIVGGAFALAGVMFLASAASA